MQKVTVGFLFTFGVFFLLSGSYADAQRNDAKMKEYIIRVDPHLLAKAVFSDSVPLKESPSFNNIGVVRKYRKRTGEQFDLVIGIYPDNTKASAALNRTLPSIAKRPAEEFVGECFFSSAACHMRMQNVAVLLIMQNGWPEGKMVSIARSLETALQDPAIIGSGSAVQTPTITVLSIISTAKKDNKVVYNVNGEKDFLMAKNYRWKTRRLANNRYEVIGQKAFSDKEMTIRVARVTGEVGEFPISTLTPSGLENVPHDEAVKKRMTNEKRANIISKLRAREGNPKEQSALVLQLLRDPTPDLIPFFEELLSSDRQATIKKFALRGLSTERGKQGIKRYREYATDKNQPELIRRDAIRLIGKFGTAEDLVVLETIRKEENEWLLPALSEAIRRLKGEPPAD